MPRYCFRQNEENFWNLLINAKFSLKEKGENSEKNEQIES